MDEGASGALVGAVVAALRAVPGLSFVADGAPVAAGDAHVVVEIGPEGDWGHKSGAGAELRFALVLRCGGERPDRARRLVAAMRGAVDGLGADVPGWRIVTLTMTRARIVREAGPGWAGIVDYRARMLAA